MNLKILTVGPLATNCYILSDTTAVVIDPGAEPEEILSELDKLSVKLTHIIYTHAHPDHTGAGYELKKKTNAEVVMGENDMDIFSDNLNQLLGIEGRPAQPDRLVSEGDYIASDRMEFKVLQTPGHTPGGISLYLNAWLFCGDTVFLNSIGRTDLPRGNPGELQESIRNKIYTLDDNVKIFPGHGPQTTVGWEKKNNLYCKI